MAKHLDPSVQHEGKCAAKLRGREAYCRQNPVKGGTRCALHGGANQLLKHRLGGKIGRPSATGLYTKHLNSKFIDDYERAESKQVTLNEEVTLTRVLVGRVLKALQDIEETLDLNSMEDLETYNALVERLLANIDRVRKLEKTRSDLDLAKSKIVANLAYSSGMRGKLKIEFNEGSPIKMMTLPDVDEKNVIDVTETKMPPDLEEQRAVVDDVEG